ncbi:MAG: hypothetical protein KBB71_11875 [Lentimicrobiaceae bacterium]|nr:hypothetical protein [Lentimicrobiaceae bacterium]
MVQMSGGAAYPQYMNSYNHAESPLLPRVGEVGRGRKELQAEADLQWYDYGARFYDPQIGRFHTVDRFTEKYYSMTPYQYGANNPILFIDVNGDSIDVSDMSKRRLEKYQARVSLLKEKSKLFNTMYTSLEKSEKIYLIQFGKTIKREDGSRSKGTVPGQFEPDEGGGTVAFKNTDIDSQAFAEELFHTYQNDNKDNYDKGDFNKEFEAKLSATAIVAEAAYGYAEIPGMENFQMKVGLGHYGEENMQISPMNVNSTSFLNSYKYAANAYAGFNKLNNIGNRYYKVSTTVAPYSLKTMVNKAYGK